MFDDRSETVRARLPGTAVKQTVAFVGHRELFVRLLGTTSGNLSRLYHRKALGRSQSEEPIDAWYVFRRAASVFGSLDRGCEWLDAPLPALGGQRPVDLCDPFEGRRLVQAAIQKIEYGEFP